MTTKIDSFPLRISSKCVSCKTHFFLNESYSSFEEVGSCTTDCPNCNTILLIKDNRTWPFHIKLHDEDPMWPKDGKDTDYLEYKPD